jgi:regulator of cell morphogenesis and NO signaling
MLAVEGTMDIATDTRVADLAVAHAGTIRVFQAYGIDYCCGGRRALSEVCRERGLDFAAVSEAVRAAMAPAAAPVFDWAGAPLDDAADRIVAVYHVPLRAELVRLGEMADKVRRVHGERHPEVFEVAASLQALVEDVTPHMMKEERMLFPYLARLAAAARAGRATGGSPFGTVANPIRVMEAEHEAVGEIVAGLRRTTGGYTAPEDACNTFRGLYHGLAALERDLHEHIHVENNIVFPRAVSLERALAGEVAAAS